MQHATPSDMPPLLAVAGTIPQRALPPTDTDKHQSERQRKRPPVIAVGPEPIGNREKRSPSQYHRCPSFHYCNVAPGNKTRGGVRTYSTPRSVTRLLGNYRAPHLGNFRRFT
jgi:hypothetical protein